VPLPPEAVQARTEPGGVQRMVIQEEVTLPEIVPLGGQEAELRVLAPEVSMAGTQKSEKFGADKVAVVLKPGVIVAASNVVHYFAPAEFNPAHAKYIARSEKAKPMAVNVYSAFWTLLVSLVVTVGVSLCTRPKPEAELKNLVYGSTQIPDEGLCPWYRSPKLWAGIVLAALIALNLIFW
jgi:hypothetical protein